MTSMVLFAALSLLALIGAVSVVVTKDVMRLTLGLGTFFVAIAGFFALYGLGFLALAQVFVYVGGVLVLVLFAVMLVHRAEPGRPSLESRHDLLAAVTCVGFVVLTTRSLGPVLGDLQPVSGAGVERLSEVLLTSMLTHFELAGLLLLAALVGVVAVSGGERR